MRPNKARLQRGARASQQGLEDALCRLAAIRRVFRCFYRVTAELRLESAALDGLGSRMRRIEFRLDARQRHYENAEVLTTGSLQPTVRSRPPVKVVAI